MEYAAVFLLFVLLTAAALRLAATGEGAGKLAFLVLLAALICAEPTGDTVKFAPASVFLACAGAAYTGYKKDLQALLCALTVAAVTVSALNNSRAGFAATEWGYVSAIALCAVVNRPESAGCVLAFGVVSGNTYSVLKDFSVILREDLYSLDTAYAAIICGVVAAFVHAVLSLADENGTQCAAPGNVCFKGSFLKKPLRFI